MDGGEEYDQDKLPDYLGTYYQRLFPADQFYKWLSYGIDKESGPFTYREFSFNLIGDIYLRYLSFKNVDEFKKELIAKRPEKIDIGAVFDKKPKLKDSTALPIWKEFVLDIDLTDYDEVRTCCSGATVCQKCWKFIAVAVKILNTALRDDFGFKHLLWVFSGRRGVHCWIADEIARKMDTSARSAVIEYLQVLRGGEDKIKKVKLPGLKIHSSIRRALAVIHEQFEDICIVDQDLFKDDKYLDLVPPEYKKRIQDAEDRWEEIAKLVAEKEKFYRGKQDKNPIRNLKDEIALQFLYPRLDVNVSKGINHLLKAPFCIHPKTGKVCVPFNPEDVDEFNIEKVPKITSILDEIGKHDKELVHEQNVNDWKKTELAPYMEVFRKFIKNIKTESTIKQQAAKSIEQANGVYIKQEPMELF